MNFSKLSFLFACCCLPIFCAAQIMDSKAYVQSLFENQEKIQWIKHYKGRIDDLNDVSVTLGFDGENCRGQINYLRSETKFKLTGRMEDRQLLLHEMDKSEKLSGSIEGKISGKTITGDWNNYNGSKGGNIWLTETEKEANFPSYCGDNKWIRKYFGKIGNQHTEIILQKESSEKVSGLIFYQNKNQSFAFKGEIDDNEKLSIQVKNQQGKIVQNLTGHLQQDQLTIADKKNPDSKKTLLPKAGLTIGCIEYADYVTGYDITFPKTSNSTFNRHMSEETDAWVKACRNHAKQITKQNTSIKPQLRATERGYAWSEVEYFSDKLISGFMTFGNTWTPGQKLIAFNFDLERNSYLYLEDIFENKRDYQKYIKNYIKKEIKNHRLYSDNDFKKWIKKSAFPYFTIRRDGICFSTKFNRLYGRQSVTIPYRQLQPFLKKKFIKLLSNS